MLPATGAQCSRVTFGLLGPVVAWDGAGNRIALKGPRHRAVLARLLVARRRVVPVSRLVEDLWTDPPPGAAGAVRTFVAALRRALEPERPPRASARLLVTDGPGYALLADPGQVDAWRFEHAVDATLELSAKDALEGLDEALGWWRGPAYADFADDDWALAERSRLSELRLHAVERQAEARLALGLAAEAIPGLDAHLAEHPWREEAWRLLALAQYRAGRQADALAVLRRGRTRLREELGIDSGPGLLRLEADILSHAEHLVPAVGAGGEVGHVWAQTTAAFDRTVAPGARARLESTVALLRGLAVTGGQGLEAARLPRMAAIASSEALGDPELTARVIGAYDVPAIWTSPDDAEQASGIVATAERTLISLGSGAHAAARARLLATVAVESRGTRLPRALEAAREAVELARGLNDPALLAFALNGLYMQSFHRTGLAAQRAEIGAELVTLSSRHGMAPFEVLGHLIGLQARSALAQFPCADRHAVAADRLAERHELPLVGVFTRWYRALRVATDRRTSLAEARSAYRDAASYLEGARMPGMERGLLPLALLGLELQRGLPLQIDDGTDWGPFEPWVRPLRLLAERPGEASKSLRDAPEPPPGLMLEALWCLVAQAAIALGERRMMERAYRQLQPSAHELAGAGSGVLTIGSVSDHLNRLASALGTN